LETLHNYSGAFYDIPIMFHEDYDGLAKKEVVNMTHLLPSLPWAQRIPLLSAGAVRLILSVERLVMPGLKELGAIRNSSNVIFYLYRNDRSASPVGFVTSWRKAQSAEEALRTLTDATFDPRKEAVLLNVASHLSSCNPAEIRTVVSGSASSALLVQNECDGYLVFAYPLFPGWKVKVDGASAEQIPANYAFSAVFLKAGRHIVERRYLPASILWGAVSSTAFGLLFVLILRLGWANQRAEARV